MNLPLRPYRLADRGGAGLACDADGLALGAVNLAWVRRDANGVIRCEVRSPAEFGRIMRTAYGSLTEAESLRLHRGLCRAAAWIAVSDLARAGIEAVMLGLPDLAPHAMAKLTEIADLEKRANGAWETEPRIPAGQTGGGQWTTGGGAPSTVAPARSAPARTARRVRAPLSRPSADSTGVGASAPARRDAEVKPPAEGLIVPVSTASASAGARSAWHARRFRLARGRRALWDGRRCWSMRRRLLDQWGDAASAR